MNKSVDPKKAAQASAFIDGALEPKIKALIEEANKLLRKRGVVIGAEIQWFIDKVEEKNEKEK